MDWKLKEEDFLKARRLLIQEKIYPLEYESMFIAGVYCILSTAEKYMKYKSVYQNFLKNDLTTPEKIINDKVKLREVVSGVRFPNTKEERIYKYSVWWLKSSLPKEILADTRTGRRNEFSLRNRLAEECPGMWYKAASLFMIKCGYRNVVPIDLWILRFLAHLGYEVKIPDYRTQSGPKPKEYLKYEKIISKIAEEHRVSPAVFQFAVWLKHSSWNKS